MFKNMLEVFLDKTDNITQSKVSLEKKCIIKFQLLCLLNMIFQPMVIGLDFAVGLDDL